MKRNTVIALLVFAVLVALGLWSLNQERARGISRIDFSVLETDGVSRIVLSGKNEAELTKEGEDWKLKGKLADSRAVEQVLEAVTKIVSSDMVTKSEARYADFEVDDENATTVEIYAGSGKVVEFKVGKAASGGSHIRANGEVYAVSGVYPGTFNKAGNAWLEKKLFKEKVNEVEKVEIKLAGQAPFTLVKQDANWELEDKSLVPEGFRFDGGAASRLVSSLVNLRAKDILDTDPGPGKTKLDKDFDVLNFLLKDKPDQARVVHLGATDDDSKTVYAKVVGRDEVMSIYESTVKNLRKRPADFRDFSMVSLDQNKVKALSIVDGGKRLDLEKKGSDWSVGKSSEKIPGDFTLDPAAVTRRLSGVNSARGVAVAEVAAAAAGLGRPKAKVTATLEDGTNVVLAFGKDTKHDGRDACYAQGNSDNAVYVVNSYTKQNLLGMLDTFKKRDTPPGGPGGGGLSNLDPAALKNLPPDVRRSLQEQIKNQQRQQKLLQKLKAKSKQ